MFFDIYLIMFIIIVMGIKLLDVIYNIIFNLSVGNVFLFMFMIGMVFECKFYKE